MILAQLYCRAALSGRVKMNAFMLSA